MGQRSSAQLLPDQADDIPATSQNERLLWLPDTSTVAMEMPSLSASKGTATSVQFQNLPVRTIRRQLNHGRRGLKEKPCPLRASRLYWYTRGHKERYRTAGAGESPPLPVADASFKRNQCHIYHLQVLRIRLTARAGIDVVGESMASSM